METRNLKDSVTDISKKSAKERRRILADCYSSMANRYLDKGKTIPDHMKAAFEEWLHDPETDPKKDEDLMRILMS